MIIKKTLDETLTLDENHVTQVKMKLVVTMKK